MGSDIFAAPHNLLTTTDYLSGFKVEVRIALIKVRVRVRVRGLVGMVKVRGWVTDYAYMKILKKL